MAANIGFRLCLSAVPEPPTERPVTGLGKLLSILGLAPRHRGRDGVGR